MIDNENFACECEMLSFSFDNLHVFRVVPVCEASVIIAISAPHRDAAIKAVQWAIDELKARVPIWKKVRQKFDFIQSYHRQSLLNIEAKYF